jgi:hypothetical protein
MAKKMSTHSASLSSPAFGKRNASTSARLKNHEARISRRILYGNSAKAAHYDAESREAGSRAEQ